jgi:RNA polymerase sigma-70 factor (ECF subfamily)
MQAASDLEAQIAQELGARDLAAAATTAIRGYGPEILGYLVTVMGDREAAHEVFASFSEQLWTGIARFDGRSSFRTWAYAVAWRVARRHRRDLARRRERRLLTAEMSKIVAEVRSETLSFLRSAAQSRLARMRESLDPEDHTLLVLRIDRRLSWKGIAQVLSTEDAVVDEAALRKRFERLKARLRRLATS